MDIPTSALRDLEKDRGIPFDRLVEDIEAALLIAYKRTDGAQPRARVQVDRASGHVTVWAVEEIEDGSTREYDDTPSEFGRIASTTAKQVILQRLRDHEDEQTFGEFAGRKGDLITGVVQQGRDPRNILIDLGKVEGTLPAAEQVPGEEYRHGERLKCYVVEVRRGPRTWCANCSRWRSRRSPRTPSRSPPSPARRGIVRRSRSARTARASTPRARASARWAHASAT